MSGEKRLKNGGGFMSDVVKYNFTYDMVFKSALTNALRVRLN